MLRRNWEQYFIVRPHEAAVERKKIADAAKKSKQELSKQVRNLKRRTVTKKVTKTVAETTTADGDVVPAHEEEKEEDVLEEEEDGDLLIPANEGVLLMTDDLDAEDFTDDPDAKENPVALAAAKALAQQSQGY